MQEVVNNTEEITEEKKIPTFDIPDYNMSVVGQKIAKLNKRGAKLGCEPIQIIIVKKWENVLRQPHDEDHILSGGEIIEVVPMTTIQVIGSAPKLNGWTLVSVVEPIAEGVLLRKFPGTKLEVPVEFRNVTPDRCDHCHTSRQRNETFIVHHAESSKWMVVGRNCLADFTGCNNPERIANYASVLYDLMISIKDEETLGSGGGGRGGYYCAPIRSFLKMVAIVSGREGFITSTEAKKRDEAGDYVSPTGKSVFYRFFHPNSTRTKESIAEKKKLYESINDEEDEKADDLVDAAMQWGKTEFVDADDNNLSDYGHNMKLLLAADRVRIIDVGFVASVIKGYKRSLEHKQERITYKGHVGTVGEKITLPVTIKRVYEYAGQYGLVYITTMQDDDGNVLTWFAKPKSGKPDVGKYLTITAKVKRHDVRKGEKSTIITNPKFI